ncbi:MAG: hypothetical protein ACREAS_04860 [Nitrososphaera sp.]
MSSVVGGPSEVETFLSRLIDGQFEIDTAHPNAKAFQSALNTYRVYKRASVVPTPQKGGRHKECDLYCNIAGSHQPRREDLDKLAREIIDKKVTEQDIDRVEGDSKAKKYLRELWNKLVDKSRSEIVEMLFSAIQTQGLHLALLSLNLAR